jgi:effector-binding domain-containing protein
METKYVDIFSLSIDDEFIVNGQHYILVDKVTIPAGFTDLQLAKGQHTNTDEEIVLEEGTQVEIGSKNTSIGQVSIEFLKQKMYESFQVNTQTDIFNKVKQLEKYPGEDQNKYLIQLLSGLTASIIFNLMKEDSKLTYTKLIRQINKTTKLTLTDFMEDQNAKFNVSNTETN